MADTVVYQTASAATPPDATIVATDDAGAAGQVQIIKLAISTDGSATVIPADAANGLDVDVTRVGGTVAVTGPLTDTELRASPVPVSGTVTASGPLTDTQLRASAVPVSDGGGALTVDGTVAATQSGTWNVGTVTAVTGITNPVAVTDNSGSLTVDGTVTANLAAGTNNIGDVDVLTIAAGDNNIGNVDIVTVPAPLSTTGGGTEATALRVTIATDSTGVLSVDDNGGALTVDGTVAVSAVAGTVAVTQSGTWDEVGINDSGNSITVDGTITASNTAGDVADDSADSGNPVKVGGKAKAFDGTDPGSVSEDDRVHFVTDLNRRQYVNTVHPSFWTVVENSASAETNNALKAAPGAGLSLYITDIIISTDAAINAKIVEDTGGSPATIAGPYYFAANGGAGLHFVTPIKATANKDIGYTTVGTSNCTVQVHGFTAP